MTDTLLEETTADDTSDSVAEMLAAFKKRAEEIRREQARGTDTSNPATPTPTRLPVINANPAPTELRSTSPAVQPPGSPSASLTAPSTAASTATPVHFLNRDTLLAQLMASAPTKWLYAENHAQCLANIMEFVLTRHETKKKRNALSFADTKDERNYLLAQVRGFVEIFNFPVLYPNLIGFTDERVEAAFDTKYKAFIKRRNRNRWVGCLSFVLEKQLAEQIPASELAIKPSPLTYPELAYILKTIGLLVRKKRDAMKQAGSIKDAPSYKLIPHAYFLGDYYKQSSKTKPPKLTANLTPEQIYQMAFTAGMERGIALSRKRTHDYCDKYKKATGKALNAHKLAKIIKLLEKHDFIETKKVPAKKLKSAFIYAYALKKNANVPQSECFSRHETQS